MSDQLTADVRPKHYTLHISIDFTTFTFNGTVETALTVTEQQRMIRQHCEGLTMHECTMNGPDGSLPVNHTLTDNEMHITGATPFTPGDYVLKCSFSGNLADDLSGLYRSRYTNATGATAYLATTQFEAPYARQTFPCFDEPQFKAKFALSIDIPAAMTGISNMPIVSETIKGDRKVIRFDTTPPMSTYLLYFGAGVFDYIEEQRGDRTIRVYGVNGKSAQGAYSLKFAADTLEYFEEYTGVPYPLPKLDLIAIPDFAAGAMENWGAVTFREVLLYVDEKETSFAARKRVAEVVAHELWHQWSGNLVTMQWWDDLWLNEAFATYIAYRAVDHFHPDWHIWDDFLGTETGRAFEMDMLSSTHPIAVTVKTPNEIEEVFDAISYGKGGSVLCMIEHYIGEEAFRKGVAAYLDKFAFRNAVAKDLWDTLEEYSGKPVKDMLVSWITTAGFPLLATSRDDTNITVHQQRFLYHENSDNTQWPIPLTWTDGSTGGSRLMQTASYSIHAASEITKLNAGQHGFYRTLYTAEMYSDFHEAIAEKRFSVHDRYGFLNDLWSGVLAGHAGLASLLELMEAYRNEDRLFVLEELHAICGRIALYLKLPENGKRLYDRYKDPFARQLDRLTWESSPTDSPEDRQLRALSIDFLVNAGLPDVSEKALYVAEAYLGGSLPDPDIRNACLGAVASSASTELFGKTKNAYEIKKGAEEKIALLGTLALFNNKDYLAQFLDYTLTKAVRRQDLRTVFARLARNPISSSLFFDWVQARWEQLSALKDSYFVYMGLIQTIILTAPDTITLDAVSTFLGKHTEGFENTKANAIEKTRMHLAFEQRESTQRIV